MASANEKQQAHQLLDQLDAGQLATGIHLLQVLSAPAAAFAGFPARGRGRGHA